MCKAGDFFIKVTKQMKNNSQFSTFNSQFNEVPNTSENSLQQKALSFYKS